MSSRSIVFMLVVGLLSTVVANGGPLDQFGGPGDPPDILPGSGETIFYEDWEFGYTQWGADPPWQVGPTTTYPSPYWGNMCAGTILTGNYPANSSGRLSSADIELPEVDGELDERLVLEFFEWTTTYNGHDWGRVQVHNGSSWVDHGSQKYNAGGGWTKTAVDLTAYAGTTVSVGFFFRSTDSQYGGDEHRGWYVDNIRILKGSPQLFALPGGFEDAVGEFGDHQPANYYGDWWASRGLWQVGQPDYGLSSSYRGDNCACTLLNGAYPANSSSRLVSPFFKIPDLGTDRPINLRFQTWYQTYNSHDPLRVYMQYEGGDWIQLGSQYSGSSSGWSRPSITMPACADSTVRLGFDLYTTDSQYGGDEGVGACIDHIYFEGLGLLATDLMPDHGNYDVVETDPIQVTFTAPANTTTIDASSFIVTGSESGTISGTFSYSWDGSAFSFTPDQPFADEETITCRLTDDILDDFGLPFDGDGDMYPGGDLVWEFCTFDHPCDIASPIPTDLVASVDGTTVSLTWQMETEETVEVYRIYRGETLEDLAQIGSMPVGTLNYDDSTGTTGTQYFYAVTSFNDVERESEYSQEVCATPGDTEAPLPPDGLDYTTGDRLITLTWDNNDECDVVAYWITRATDGGEPAVIDTVAVDVIGTTTYADDGIENFVEYCYVIQAVDNAGLSSDPSSTACATAEGAVADLAVVKTVSESDVSVGQTVTFTVNVMNNGPDTAPTPLVLDLLPEGFTFVSAVPSRGEYGELTGEWLLEPMLSGDVDSLLLSATVDVPVDTLKNIATASDIGSSDIVPDNDTGTAWVVGHACDLALTKTVDNTEPNVGDEIVFKVTVANLGPDAAEQVAVVDALPGGLLYTSVVKSTGTYVGDVWQLGTMPAGQVDSMMVFATVVEAASITNSAEVSAATPLDLDEENDDGEATISGHAADLSLTKSADPISPAIDSPVTFSLTVHNAGPSTASNIVVVDDEPSGLSDVTYDAPVGSSFDAGTWTIDELSVGGSMTLTISATMASEDPVTNCGSIVSSDQSDPDPNNDLACVTVSSDPVDLSLTKSVDQEFPALGDTVTFTVIVENHTDYEASGIRVLDRAAPGLSFVNVAPSAGTYEEGTGIWSFDTLAYGAQDTLIIRAQVDMATTIVNTASLVGSDQADPDQGNNSAEVTIEGQAADLAVLKTLDNSYPDVGDIITFVVTVKNNGPSPAADVHVQDLLPSGMLALHDYEHSGVDYDTISGDWHVGELAVGVANGKTLTVQAEVLATDPFTNYAEISASSLPDLREDNNMAAAGGHLTFADLAVSKEVSHDTPAVNTQVTYTLTVSNDGPDTATDIVVRDVLPDGVTYVSHAANPGEYVDGLWTISSLADDASATLAIVVTADAMEEITNLAEIISFNGIDSDLSNNSAVEDMVPVDPPPFITIESISEGAVGEPVTVTVTVTDNVGVQTDSVTLHYCQGMSGEYSDVIMSQVGTSDEYEGVIPGEAVTVHGVDCYVSALDEAGNRGESLRGAVTVAVAMLTNPSSQPGGTEQSAYRMISIPLDLGDSRPGPVMEDDLGTYDPQVWKMFGLNESQTWENSEFPNCGDVIPGRGFFLIVKEAGKIIDAGPGATVHTGEPFAINLHQGWNLIGNPYNFAVSVSALSLESADPVDVRNYIGSYAELSNASSLEPFSGYLVAAENDGDRLFIDPAGFLDKALPTAAKPDVVSAIGIAARIGDACDDDNVAIIAEAAAVDRDHLDRPEPPVIGDYVSVSFPHPEWETPFPAYCKDARPDDDESTGHTWDVEVRTNLSGRIELTFDGIESVPNDRQVWLRDELLLINVNLRDTAEYTFAGASDGSPRSLRLVVGDEDYIAEALPADELVPTEVMLFANFPNPFNPLTTIRYGLPHAGRVQLAIYDVRGRLVTKLVDEQRPAGYHAVIWAGDDLAGRRVASGVYLYRLVTDDSVKTEKMLLMK